MTTKSKEFIEHLRHLSNDLSEAGQKQIAKVIFDAAETIQSMRNLHIVKDELIKALGQRMDILEDKVERLVPKRPAPLKKSSSAKVGLFDLFPKDKHEALHKAFDELKNKEQKK